MRSIICLRLLLNLLLSSKWSIKIFYYLFFHHNEQLIINSEGFVSFSCLHFRSILGGLLRGCVLGCYVLLFCAFELTVNFSLGEGFVVTGFFFMRDTSTSWIKFNL